MKYIKPFKKLNENISPTDELLHLISDDILFQWEIIKQRNDDNYRLFYSDFKKIPTSKVKNLLNKGADINAHLDLWGSLIKLAVYRQDLNLIKCLLKNGANVNGTDKDRKSSTPIYVAASINYQPTSTNIIKYLISKGADINIPNDGDILPLHTALFHQNFDNAIILLKAGSLFNTKSSFNHRNKDNSINRWMKVGNYEFEKVLCQMYPEEISKIDDDKIDPKIKEEFPYLFSSNKFNL